MPVVSVIGAGTMGAGIAQTAAAAGWRVRLMDANPEAAAKAVGGIRRSLDRLVEKQKLTATAAAEAIERIAPANAATELSDSDLVVEAIVEDLETKIRVLSEIARHTRPDTLFTTNTSSLSVTKIGFGLGAPDRTVGMHFFNPVPLMPLVEVISGAQTSPRHADRVYAIAKEWKKTPVRVKDTPGFIVNRVARGYYLESLRMLDEGIAGVDEIDRTLKSLGGFRMGPFELMDLIGIDVNYTVSCSVWEQMGRPARLTPHPIQKRLFDAGQLGRKAGRGFYGYQQEPPLPAVSCDRKSFECPAPVYQMVRLVFDGAVKRPAPAAGAAPSGSITEQYVLARVLATIINEAYHALGEEVATAADIDTAMKLGTNYPLGPCEWAEQIGRHTVAGLLRQLDKHAGDGRFEPARALT